LSPAARLSLAAAFLFAAAALPAGAPAAGPDNAYASVTRFASGGSGPAPAPGTFQADFQTASTPVSAPKMPFGLGKMVGSMQNATAMFKNGLAQRTYVGTTKERIDSVAAGTADITDCTARTITHLDLNAKTYSVTSMDQPQAPSSGGGHSAPGPAPTDDGSKYAIDMTTKALGPMTIEGVATNGYSINMKVTATKPTGETSSFNTEITTYYAGFAEPAFSCPGHLNFTPAGGPAGPSLMQTQMIMGAMGSKGNPRFTFTNSGPSVPGGRFSMWQMSTFAGQGRGGAFNVVMERGNVSTVSDGDPVFSVPAGFTKV